jgi:hypothetical protein
MSRGRRRKGEIRWARGSEFARIVAAPDAHREILRIGEKFDVADPPTIVRESRSTRAVLHPCFEWDDAVAAEKHRLHQARAISNHLVVVDAKGVQTPSLVSVQLIVDDEPRRGYMSIDTVVSDKEMRDQVIAEAWRGFDAWKRRYGALKELAAVFAAAEKLRR